MSSNFNKELVKETINKIKDPRTTVLQNARINQNQKKITWTTTFKNLIKPTKEEQQLVPNTLIAYTKPMTFRSHLTNYKGIAKGFGRTSNEDGKSFRCGKCGLCGGYPGFENMVKETKVITSNRNTFQLKQDLCCQNFGIYAALCRICEAIYVGQTCTSFKKRWGTHRATWRKMCSSGLKEENNDEQALYRHFISKHPDKGEIPLQEAYEVVFLTQPQRKELDTEESFWITKLHAEINVNKTFLPKFK